MHMRRAFIALTKGLRKLYSQKTWLDNDSDSGGDVTDSLAAGASGSGSGSALRKSPSTDSASVVVPPAAPSAHTNALTPLDQLIIAEAALQSVVDGPLSGFAEL